MVLLLYLLLLPHLLCFTIGRIFLFCFCPLLFLFRNKFCTFLYVSSPNTKSSNNWLAPFLINTSKGGAVRISSKKCSISTLTLQFVYQCKWHNVESNPRIHQVPLILCCKRRKAKPFLASEIPNWLFFCQLSPCHAAVVIDGGKVIIRRLFQLSIREENIRHLTFLFDQNKSNVHP